ncbi:S8 family serine peptidase [Pseudomonas fluorescens]|nr:S8 family serine peptidase [Pseudomonas fluorescens]
MIYAGPNGDRIQASAAGSIIHAGGGADLITGGAADDVIEAGRGNATIDGAGGVNLVTLHGNHDEYLITRTATGYQISDRQAERDGSLTLSNIQKLSFADIAAVDLQAPGALPIGDTLAPVQLAAFTTTPAALVIPASVLLANDQPLNSTGPLRIASVSDGKGATVRLNEQGDVEVTPLPGHDTDVTFRYDLVDAAGNPSLGVTEVASGASAPLRATVTLRHQQSPVDPLAARQWYLNEIDVQPVWRDFSGKGVRIGQFEPGGEFAVAPEIFDIRHPDLQANIDPIWLQTQRSNGTLPALASNHATQVAGVMVGARNDQGGIGIAYDAKLGGHYLANKGDDLTSLGQMVNYDIANHSWGFKTDFAIGNVPEGRVDTSLALAFSATLAATNGRGGLGTVIVTSGGNQREQGGSAQGSLINNSRHAIEVAAVNAKADLSVLQVASAPFSNPGSSLLVAAPGSHVLSSGINLEAERGAKVGSAYGTTQGTSFAAPIVSGVVALMLQANPGLGYRDVQQILALSARKVDDPATAWRDNAGFNWNGGGMRASHDYGFGMVDARAAVRLAESWAGQSSKANEQQLSAGSEALAKLIAPGQVSTFALNMPAGVLVEHVEVDIHSQVGRLGDMTVTLISPGGTRSVLLDRAGKAPGSAEDDLGNLRSGEFKYGFMSTHHRGERSVGEWRLEVSNAGSGLPLTLDRWALRVVGSPSNANDVYYYTNDYADAVAQNAARAVLDDAVNGTAGGRNTLNAAALSRSISVDLVSGIASIGGAALTIAPGAVQNLIGGDGDDTLIAGAQGAWLDGGRGYNLLKGGSGTDRYVIHKRADGRDELEQFEHSREIVDLVGFAGKTFADLQLNQEGSAAVVGLGNGQTLRFADRAIADLQPDHFRFMDSPIAAPGYFDGTPEGQAQVPVSATVLLSGGAEGVSLSADASGQFVASLKGTIYGPSSVTPSVFVVGKQDGVTDYKNTLRGFRHGIDKIDLSQTGISRYEDLQLTKDERFQLNGFAQIHGVTVADQGSRVKLLYLDALELAQVTPDDFIFAPPAAAALPVMAPVQTPNLANLVDAMAAFAPQAISTHLLAESPDQRWESTIAVAA